MKFASKSFIESEIKRIQTGKVSLEKINSIVSEIGDKTDLFSKAIDSHLLDPNSSFSQNDTALSYFTKKKSYHLKSEIKAAIKVSKILDTGEPFTDPEFPPSIESIYDQNDDRIPKEGREHYERLGWERLSVIYPD